MINIGLFRHIVTFKRLQDVQTPTGAVEKKPVVVASKHAKKKRFSNVTDKDKVEAGKDFYGHFGIFEVRADSRIKDCEILEYDGVEYKIILIDKTDDNTYLINVNKINE